MISGKRGAARCDAMDNAFQLIAGRLAPDARGFNFGNIMLFGATVGQILREIVSANPSTPHKGESGFAPAEETIRNG
jgi:hypothetical protein